MAKQPKSKTAVLEQQAEQQQPVTKPSPKKKASTLPNLRSSSNTAPLSDSDIQLVTSWGLKRKTVRANPTLLKMVLSAEDYRELQVIGMKLGVTWDEVLKGLMNRELCSLTPGDGLADHIPALQ